MCLKHGVPAKNFKGWFKRCHLRIKIGRWKGGHAMPSSQIGFLFFYNSRNFSNVGKGEGRGSGEGGFISVSASVRQLPDPSNGDINRLTPDRQKRTPPPKMCAQQFSQKLPNEYGRT